ncbi:MAG: hypothetical protein CFE43_09255 [Burkholderiales bacterium PBB3]|nr:MAG: hypothetical protein CFE43_09255 [Burkholderiales bacterium PBB3]
MRSASCPEQPFAGESKRRLGVDVALRFAADPRAETQPLLVTCAGIDIDIGAAKARLRARHARKRVPTLMKLVARLAKNKA